MNELQTRCLDTFPEWLRTLASDAGDLAPLVGAAETPEPARRLVAGALNYLFKSLDLVPDGIEDLGFLDDAFVLRVAAALAARASEDAAKLPVVARLAAGAPLIADLLGKDYARLERYVEALTKGAARGRTVDEIVGDEGVRSAFLSELAGFRSSYDAPSFTRDEKNLVKLQSFLAAKLPA